MQLGLHPIFQRLNRLSDNKVFNRGREVAGDLRERWETSDSPLVQRIQASLSLSCGRRIDSRDAVIATSTLPIETLCKHSGEQEMRGEHRLGSYKEGTLEIKIARGVARGC